MLKKSKMIKKDLKNPSETSWAKHIIVKIKSQDSLKFMDEKPIVEKSTLLSRSLCHCTVTRSSGQRVATGYQ